MDNLDIFILKEIWTAEETTTWIIAKKYFNLHEPETKKEREILNCRCQQIKDRLKRLSKLNLVTITKSKPNGQISKNIYTLNIKNLKIGKNNFPNKKSEAIFLKIEGKWEIFEI